MLIDFDKIEPVIAKYVSYCSFQSLIYLFQAKELVILTEPLCLKLVLLQTLKVLHLLNKQSRLLIYACNTLLLEWSDQTQLFLERLLLNKLDFKKV